MNDLALDGLDGANPLHLLAALGALVLTDDLTPGATLRWQRTGGRHAPLLGTGLAPRRWSEQLAARLREMAAVPPSNDEAPARRKVDELGAALKRELTGLKALAGELKAEATRMRLVGAEKKAWGRDRLDARRQIIRGLETEKMRAQEEHAKTLGFGPAHLGEVIGVPVSVFRLHAEHALAHDPASARQLAALGTDACTENNALRATPFSFSNGGSGKKLLKDFKTLARACTAEKLEASLLLGAPVPDDLTSLNWDPADLRSYAHQWSDPADTRIKARTDAVANALAYAGLSLLPCFPGRRDLEAVGFLREDGKAGFTWPIWEPALGVDVVRAMLATVGLPSFAASEATARPRGIVAVFRSARVNPTGKRNFFAPSTPRVG